MTRYDWMLVRRTIALGLLLGVLSLVVMVGTDEVASTLGGRMARFACVAPIVGAGATFLSLQQARARGEMRALEAAGARPMRAYLGPLMGGLTIGALGPILALLPSADLGTLFPVALPTGSDWAPISGSWQDAGRGIVVHASGALEQVAPGRENRFDPSPIPRAATALSLALSAVGCPVWAAAPRGGAHRTLVASAVVLGAIVIFHLVGAGRLSAALLGLPPLALLLDTWILNRRTRWA